MFYDTHSGYDWLMPEGTPILAVAEGEVTFAGIGPPGPCPPLDREVDDQQQVIILHVAPRYPQKVCKQSGGAPSV